MPAPVPTSTQEDEAVYRMAAMVARGISVEELFQALAKELQRLLSVRAVRLVALESRGTERTVAAWSADAREPVSGEPRLLSAPILVDGRAWGAIRAGTTAEAPLGQRAERIMEAFSELLAMAVGAARERARVQQLEQEQRALRSVAMLVARGTSSEGLYSAVTGAAGEVLGVDIAALGRIEPDGVDYIASWTRSGDYVDVTGLLDTAGDDTTIVSTPVMVDGRPWGVMTVFATAGGHLPADTAQRLSAFTELLGTAIGTVSSREQLARLAAEEAALRRVATLVAQSVDPRRVFAAVTEEVGRLLDADLAALGRVDEGRSTLDVVATWSRSGDPAPHGRSPLTGENVIAAAVATGAPARVSDYTTGTGPLVELARSFGVADSVSVPIVVQGSVWGVIVVASADGRSLQNSTEVRLSDFTELVAAAIANAESRDELAASRARIFAAADDARARIERDLQEGVQQRLVSLGLSLRTAVAALPPAELTELRETLERLRCGFADAYADLQEIARGIHPAILAEGGLRPAVAALARRSPIPVHVEIPELPRLSDNLEVAAYYAASEALTNAIKHGRPTAVHVVAGLSDGVLNLSVSDDGIGGADPSAGSGLLGLRDRIETLSGTMRVTSEPGSGTSISIALPVLPR
jgi:signal transduction histidine kinase